MCVCDCHSLQVIEIQPNQGYIASRQLQNKASARFVSMAVYYIIYPILIREAMATWTIPHINGNENMYPPFWISWFFHEKSHCHPNCFACLWFCFGWRVYRNFRVLQRVALVFQWNNTVAYENETIFIAICYWSKLLKIWFGIQRVLLYNSARSTSMDVLN